MTRRPPASTMIPPRNALGGVTICSTEDVYDKESGLRLRTGLEARDDVASLAVALLGGCRLPRVAGARGGGGGEVVDDAPQALGEGHARRVAEQPVQRRRDVGDDERVVDAEARVLDVDLARSGEALVEDVDGDPVNNASVFFNLGSGTGINVSDLTTSAGTP